MQIQFHSNDALFTKALKEYCEEKLSKPIDRHRIDRDTVRLDLDASLHRESTGLRVRLNIPGATIAVSTLHPDAYAAVDLASDKLSRKLRDTEDRRRALQRRRGNAMLGDMADEAEDIFTADEEEVLREMGALDAVLNV